MRQTREGGLKFSGQGSGVGGQRAIFQELLVEVVLLLHYDEARVRVVRC